MVYLEFKPGFNKKPGQGDRAGCQSLEGESPTLQTQAYHRLFGILPAGLITFFNAEKMDLAAVQVNIRIKRFR